MIPMQPVLEMDAPDEDPAPWPEEWREWPEVTDGSGEGWFGHGPDAAAERLGGAVRLTPASGPRALR
ncbi:hypothetical protein [Kitasatospora sp. NPDC017646]|uniref:hypothetical protein n=1 Tax=Kitasatospora sp. NPDC017646 TaxID=3364024 RepID=UPI0037B71751